MGQVSNLVSGSRLCKLLAGTTGAPCVSPDTSSHTDTHRHAQTHTSASIPASQTRTHQSLEITLSETHHFLDAAVVRVRGVAEREQRHRAQDRALAVGQRDQIVDTVVLGIHVLAVGREDVLEQQAERGVWVVRLHAERRQPVLLLQADAVLDDEVHERPPALSVAQEHAPVVVAEEAVVDLVADEPPRVVPDAAAPAHRLPHQ
eukprot:531392-Rhodomonas_salina.1